MIAPSQLVTMVRSSSLCTNTRQVWVLAIFCIFTAAVLATKKAYTQALIMLVTQLPALYIYHQ